MSTLEECIVDEKNFPIGQCTSCTRVVKASPGWCKNCYWQCEICKQVTHRLHTRRRFYKNSILCESCYREEIFRVAVIPPRGE